MNGHASERAKPENMNRNQSLHTKKCCRKCESFDPAFSKVGGFLGQSLKSTVSTVQIPMLSEKAGMNNLDRNKAVAFRKFFLSATALIFVCFFDLSGLPVPAHGRFAVFYSAHTNFSGRGFIA